MGNTTSLDLEVEPVPVREITCSVTNDKSTCEPTKPEESKSSSKPSSDLDGVSVFSPKSSSKFSSESPSLFDTVCQASLRSTCEPAKSVESNKDSERSAGFPVRPSSDSGERNCDSVKTNSRIDSEEALRHIKDVASLFHHRRSLKSNICEIFEIIRRKVLN